MTAFSHQPLSGPWQGSGVRWAGRKGARWLRAQAQCMAEAEANRTPCHRCGGPIDYELTRNDHLHRMAGTADHIQELWQGGDPLDQTNLAPCHRGCNSRKSNQLRRALRAGQIVNRNRRTRTPPVREVPSSRRW